MQPHFDPKLFPERVIFIDTNRQPPVEKMNCLACGRLVEALWKNDELCEGCYEKWSEKFCRKWAKERFGK